MLQNVKSISCAGKRKKFKNAQHFPSALRLIDENVKFAAEQKCEL